MAFYGFGRGGRPRGPRQQFDPSSGVLLVAAALLGYALVRRGFVPTKAMVYFAMLVPSVILHEVSHGAIAFLFGDRTAKDAGRLTLNPVRHVDLWGTILIPAALIFTTGLAFGYAKPVPVNVGRMTRNQAMWTGLIGPITNIVIALLAALALNLVAPEGIYQDHPLSQEALLQLGAVNVVLATFNLLPIPPLDGASLLERFLPARHLQAYYQFRQYSMLILLGLYFFASNLVSNLLLHVVNLWGMLLP